MQCRTSALVDWFLLSPLAAFEVLSSRVEGRAIVLSGRFSINMMALTLEQVLAKLQRAHVQLLDVITSDLQQAEPPKRALLELTGAYGSIEPDCMNT